MLTETITWHPVPGDELPDADLTVLVRTVDCAKPVWLGYVRRARWPRRPA